MVWFVGFLTERFSAQDHNIKIRLSNVPQNQVGFHHMLYCRALGKKATSFHTTTALLFITNPYRWVCFKHLILNAILPTTVNYNIENECHYCYCCWIILPSFPTSLSVQAEEIGILNLMHWKISPLLSTFYELQHRGSWMQPKVFYWSY